MPSALFLRPLALLIFGVSLFSSTAAWAPREEDEKGRSTAVIRTTSSASAVAVSEMPSQQEDHKEGDFVGLSADSSQVSPSSSKEYDEKKPLGALSVVRVEGATHTVL